MEILINSKTTSNPLRSYGMTISHLQYTQDIAIYKKEIQMWKERVESLKEIEEQHRILNGKLREEIQYLRHQITYEGSQNYDDGI